MQHLFCVSSTNYITVQVIVTAKMELNLKWVVMVHECFVYGVSIIGFAWLITKLLRVNIYLLTLCEGSRFAKGRKIPVQFLVNIQKHSMGTFEIFQAGNFSWKLWALLGMYGNELTRNLG